MGNIIDAYVYDGRAETKPLYQYDYGQILKFYKLTLPEAYEVHFANKTNSKISYISIGGSNGVLIPDEVLREPGIAYAWLFLHTGENDGETKVVVTIPVIERAGINTVEPTPTQRDAIDEAIEALDAAVSKCEESVAHYPKVVEGYWYVWDGEEGDFVNTDVSAHGEQGPEGPQGPAGQDGSDGQNGQDGRDGEDGFSPIATVNKVGNTATITITDKNGTTTAEISDGNYENLIDDTTSTSVKAWSSLKTSNELDGKMDKENPTGSGTLSIGRKNGTSIGRYSSAVGFDVTASGNFSHAEGYGTKATGDNSHAEGNSTEAKGFMSHTEGRRTVAWGDSSHAEGYGTIAVGYYSHTEGTNSITNGDNSHAEGYDTQANGANSHAEGHNTSASGDNSHAEGENTKAKGSCCHAEGYNTIAELWFCHAEGTNTFVNGYGSHVEGCDNQITEGVVGSHVEGTLNTSSAQCCHVEGCGNSGVTQYAHIGGKYSITDEQNEYAEVIGNGSANNNRSNARTLDWEGNEVLSGKLTINGTPTEPNDVARLQDVNRSFTNILDFSDVSVPHDTYSSAVSWNMNKGKYLLHVICRFGSGTQGLRHMALANNPSNGNFYESSYFTQTDCPALGTEIINLNMMTFVSIPANNSPVYVRAYQTNTRQENINMSVRVQYYKISD